MSADAQPQLEQQPQQQAAQEQPQQQQQQQPEQQAPEESSAQEQPPKEKKPNPLKNILKTLFGCLRKPKVTDETNKEHAAGAEKEAKKALVADEDGQAEGHDGTNENANAAAPATAGAEEKAQAVPDHLGGATEASDGKGVTTTISAN